MMVQCARCGAPVEVPETFDVFEDMRLCVDCDEAMSVGFESHQVGPTIHTWMDRDGVWHREEIP